MRLRSILAEFRSKFVSLAGVGWCSVRIFAGEKNIAAARPQQAQRDRMAQQFAANNQRSQADHWPLVPAQGLQERSFQQSSTAVLNPPTLFLPTYSTTAMTSPNTDHDVSPQPPVYPATRAGARGGRLRSRRQAPTRRRAKKNGASALASWARRWARSKSV